MVRAPVVSGQFYNADPVKLMHDIKKCFQSPFGPGDYPKKSRDKKIIGLISPHAGYMFSGSCAAWAYKEIGESRFPDTFIMLGLSHNGFPTSISIEDWKTPFGIIKNDIEFQKVLAENSPIKIDEKAHLSEHSIEVQLPLLQFVNKDKINKLRIAPIICSPDMDYEKIAGYIFDAIKKTRRNVIIIASSDFTHFGMNYGYIPFRHNIKENMYSLDKAAIGQITALKPEKFLEYIENTGATICGNYPIAVLLSLSKKLRAKKAALLKYYTSGDITGDYSSAVGYAAIKVE
jgi:MEMO1 family protein